MKLRENGSYQGDEKLIRLKICAEGCDNKMHGRDPENDRVPDAKATSGTGTV